MDEEDGISLNIHHSSHSHDKISKRESKAERIKRIRKEKRDKLLKTSGQQKTKEVEVNESPSKSEKRVKSSKHLERKYDEGADSTSKFSSLFRNNPEIPEIPKATVNKTKEDVFTGDNFAELDLHPHLVSCLEQRLGITQLTAVQKRAIPTILSGSDVMIKSQTGSGKTLCYAVPIVQQLQALEPRVERAMGPYALVIVPTRELASQSYECIRTLIQPFQRIVPGVLMGGEKKSKEKARLRKGINIVIGTPGRLMDHLQNTKCLQHHNIRYVIIDEADRLLDMGFELEVKQILSDLDKGQPGSRQIMLLSATLSQGVSKLAGISLDKPVTIDVAHSNQEQSKPEVTSVVREQTLFTLPEGLKHHLVVVPSKLRLVTLAAFILWKTKYTKKNKKMIVFLATNDSVEFHHNILHTALCKRSSKIKGVDENGEIIEENGENEDDAIPLYKLYGDMPQKERLAVYREFSDTETGVLFCTDVAARGLDLPHVRWIVQYNTPGSATDYIHRVGRTARIGSQGHALLFLAPTEVEFVRVLQRHQISLAEMKMDDILKTLLIEVHNSNDEYLNRNIRTVQESATALQRKLEDLVHDDTALRTQARKAYSSFVRAYSTHSRDVKHIFQPKSLHLGHVAKSFALKDRPTNIGEIVSKTAARTGAKRKYDGEDGNESRPKQGRIHMVSEFSSGLEKSKPTKPQTSRKGQPGTSFNKKKKIFSKNIKRPLKNSFKKKK